MRIKSMVILAGNLDSIGLSELLQLIGSNSYTGILRIRNKYVQDAGLIYVIDGNTVDASNGSLTGIDALYSLFGWITGEFEFSKEQVTRKNVIKKSPMEIILDGLKMLDDGEIEKVGPVSVQKVSRGETDKETTIPLIKGPLVDYLYVVDEEGFSDGEKITQEGKHGSWMWVILEGVVEVARETPKGPLSIVRLGVGAFIASFSAFLIKGNIRSANVVAVGNVQLGVLDTERLFIEYGHMSNEFKGLVLSLDKRLREVSDRAIEFFSGQNSLKAFVKDRKKVIKQGSKEDRMLRITQGEASIVRHTKHGYVPLANLSKGDFVGHVPFLDIGHEPYSASVLASKDMKVSALDPDSLQKEYDQLSTTLRNLLENAATCVSVTTKLACDFYKKRGVTMTTTNKRKHPRFGSLNLLSYVCVDENNNLVKQGMGRTLNVSEGGILLETHIPIDAQYTVSLTIGLEDDLMTDINGKIVHSKAGQAGRFESGIEFQEIDEETLRILRKYIKAFEEQKNKTS